MLSNPALDIAIGLVYAHTLYRRPPNTTCELKATIFSLKAEAMHRGYQQNGCNVLTDLQPGFAG